MGTGKRHEPPTVWGTMSPILEKAKGQERDIAPPQRKNVFLWEWRNVSMLTMHLTSDREHLPLSLLATGKIAYSEAYSGNFKSFGVAKYTT